MNRCVLGVLGVTFVACAAHWPHATAAISFAVLTGGVLLWSRAGSGRAAGYGRAPRYVCHRHGPGGSWSTDSAAEAARHEAGHTVQIEAEGGSVARVGIGSDGSGLTISHGHSRRLSDEAQLRVSVAGTLAERPSGWFGERPINGSGWDSNSDFAKARKAARAIAAKTGRSPADVIAEAQSASRKTLERRAQRLNSVAARLEEALAGPTHGKHEGWIEQP